MLKKDLAAALGISASMVSRLTRQGMPTDSAAAAQAWRAAHLDPARVVRARADTQGQLNPLTLVQQAGGLWILPVRHWMPVPTLKGLRP